MSVIDDTLNDLNNATPESQQALGKSIEEQGLGDHNNYSDPWLYRAADVARGVLNAPSHLASNVLDLANDATGKPLGEIPEFNPLGNTTTAAGGLAQGITEFATDMVVTAGAFKGLGLAKGIKALTFGKSLLPLAEGAVADFTAFREHNSRLSDLAWNLGENHPFLRNTITDFLRDDKGDNWLEGRLKNVLEGAGLGGATGLLMGSLKLLKGSRAVEAGKMSIGDLNKMAQELEPNIESFVRGQKDFTGGISDNTAKAVLMRIGQLQPADADGALTSLKSMSSNLGTDFGSLLRDKLTTLSSRTFDNTKAVTKASDELLSNVQRIAWGADSQNPPQDIKAYVSSWASPINPTFITVNNEQDLKTLFKAADQFAPGATPRTDSEINQAISQALKKAGTTADVAFKPGVSVSAPDLLNPTNQLNFGLWRRFMGSELTQRPVEDYMNAVTSGVLSPTKLFQATDQPFGPLSENRLWQSMESSPASAKGMVEFADQGKAMVTLFENADATTFVHEMSHIIRRNMPQADIQKLAETLGVKDWKNWTRSDEELFAKSVEDKVFNGKSSVPELDAVLGRTQKIMSGVYRDLRASAIGGKVSVKLQDFYETQNGVASADAPVLTTSDQDQLKQAGQVIADAMSKGSDFSKALDDNGINLFHVNASDNLLKLAGSVSKFVEDYVAPHLKDVESREAVMQQATKQAMELGTSTEAFMSRLSDISGNTKNLSTSVAESRLLIHTVISDFDQASKAAASNRTVETASRFLSTWDQVQKAMTYYRETQASIGRSLGIFNSTASPISRISQLEQLAKRGGADEVWKLVDEANRISALTPGGAKTVALRRLMEQNKFWGVLNEFRINSMLGSGPGFGADAVSNAFKTLTMPLEKALASGFSLDMAGVRESMSAYRAFGNQLFDSFRATAACFKLGDTILDNTIENGHQAFIKGSTFGLSGTGLGRAIDLLGTVVRLPSRLRMTGDEFFKQLNYRAFMESKFVREAMENGVKDVDSYVSSKMFQSFDEIGRGINSDALDYARQATFSTPLVSGFSGMLMRQAANFPAIRLLVPFIKTPLNIFFDTVGHTPLIGAILKDQRTALMSGLNTPAAREVLAKWSLGGALLATGVYLHHAGVLTGRGSMDQKTQEQMKLDGWQPYSIAYTDSNGKKAYLGFNRIEPWGSLLGLMADYCELGPSMQDFQVDKATTAMKAAVSRNVTNKTYLKGITDFLTALGSDQGDFQKYVASSVGSFVPRSLSIFSGDPYVREARGVMDGIRAKIPGASEALPPRRNLLGEPIDVTKYSPALPADISPFAFSESVKDPVKVELASLGNGFKNPDPVQYGVDYRAFKSPKGQTAYDRMLELVGKTQIDGKNISQTLNGLINTKDYSKLVSSGDAGLPYRIKTVGQVLAKFHVASEEQMLKEFPQLRLQVQTGRIKKASDLFNAVQQLQQSGQSPQ